MLVTEAEILSRVPAAQSEVHLGEGVGYWTDAAADVGDWAADAYDRADEERAINFNTPDMIDRVARDVRRVVDDAQDLTKDFWNAHDQHEAQDAAAVDAEAEADEAEAQDEADDAEGDAIHLRAIERLSAAELSATASARTLLALRTRLLIERRTRSITG
jgi:hypothetical protein